MTHTHDPGNPIVNETGEVCTNENHYKGENATHLKRNTKGASKAVSVEDTQALTGVVPSAQESTTAELQKETSEPKQPAKTKLLKK